MKVSLDYFVKEVIPTIRAKDGEDYKQTVLDYVESKAIDVVDEEGNPIELDGVLMISAPAAPEEEPAAEEEPVQTESIARSVEAAVAKALAEMDRRSTPKAPKEKWTLPATVKRYGRVKNFRGERNGFSAEERAYRFGQFALAVYGSSTAKSWCDKMGLKVHVEGTNTTGGYLVPDEFGMDMIDLREQFGVARNLLKIRPMSSDQRSDPRRTGGLTATFAGENAALTESTKSWDRVELIAKKLTVLSRVTTELNEDALLSVGDDLAGEISYAFTEKEDDCFINGTGTSTYGGIVGIRQRLGDVNGTDDGGGLVLAAGNLWSEITMADMMAMIGRLPHYADTPNTAWLVHRAFFAEVMLTLMAAQGGVTQKETAEGERGRFMFQGYPVEISQKMPSAESNSQIAALLGDYSLAGSFGDRRRDTIAFSEHGDVGGENAFEQDFIAVRGTERFDINIHDVGTATVAGPVVGLITASA